MESLRESQMQQRKCRTVVLFPLPLQGHINPMLQLANILYSKGFSIVIIHTISNSPDYFNHPHFTFHSIPDNLLEHEAHSSDVIRLVKLININCAKPFHDTLAKLLSRVSQEPICCLITDANMFFAQDIADTLKLPRIVLRTSSICAFLAVAASALLRQQGYDCIQDSQPEEPVLELPPLKVKDLPVIKTPDAEDFQRWITDMMSKTKASAGLIWNSDEGLEQVALTALRQEFSIPIFTIGPFTKYFAASSSSLLPLDKTCISWLDSQAPNSVLYVSFGSIVAIDEAEFLEIAWGVANSNVPFLWVVRPGSVQGFQWLQALPDGFAEKVVGRGHIVKWAPQQEVLAHPATGGFWTHSGWNSTVESICEGVPMICYPRFGDQMVNARYVSDIWKVGLHLEGKIERKGIERAIGRLMVEAEGQEMRDRTMSLKDKVDVSLKSGGSSHQSLWNLITYISSF